MSGLVRGKIECVLNTGNRQSMNQVFFKNLYDFFSNHPNYSIIALQYGLTGSNLPGSTSSGTGTGYYDQANSFGYNAFFVARANATLARPFDVYYLFQWAGSNTQAGANQTFGAALGPGNPGLIRGSNLPGGDANAAGVAWAAAIGIGGTGGTTNSPNNGNPWKGTQNVNGLDLKTQVGPIWSAPPGGGIGVMIFPRSNSGAFPQTPGSFVSKAQNCGELFQRNSDVVQSRMNIVGDDDSFVIFVDDSDNGNYYMQYAGLFTPRPNIGGGLIPYPFCTLMIYNNIPIPVNDGNLNGTTVGTTTFEGGVCMQTSGSVASCTLDQWANNFMFDSNFNPDHQIPGNPYNEFPFWLGINESTPQNLSGYLGTTSFFKCMFNVPTNDTKSDFSRIFIGSTTLAQQKVSVPWDSQNNTVPRSGATRAGTTFVTNTGAGI